MGGSQASGEGGGPKILGGPKSVEGTQEFGGAGGGHPGVRYSPAPHRGLRGAWGVSPVFSSPSPCSAASEDEEEDEDDDDGGGAPRHLGDMGGGGGHTHPVPGAGSGAGLPLQGGLPFLGRGILGVRGRHPDI